MTNKCRGNGDCENCDPTIMCYGHYFPTKKSIIENKEYWKDLISIETIKKLEKEVLKERLRK
jgi:hypothetical protein